MDNFNNNNENFFYKVSHCKYAGPSKMFFFKFFFTALSPIRNKDEQL